jgi:hypothetical protein
MPYILIVDGDAADRPQGGVSAMLITAKFASVCPTCGQPINVGSRVEWSRGAKAVHQACVGAGKGAAPAPSASPSTFSYQRGSRSGGGARGKATGCSCGSREMPDGTLSAGACKQCRYDAE